MKTLKKITLSLLFIAFATFAMAKNVGPTVIGTTDDLRQALSERIKADFGKPNNYLNDNDIRKIIEKVEVVFFVDSNQNIQIISANSKNEFASEYIKNLFKEQKINVSDDLTGMVYRVNLILNYTAV